MTCRPEHVSAYVDGELAPAARAEIEEHLAICAACAAQVSEERALRGRLRALEAPVPPAGLEHAVRRRLRGAGRRPTPLVALRVALPLAATLLLALAWGRASAPVVALQLSQDHAHCYGAEKLPAKVFASDTGTVAEWFAAQGRALPPLPERAAGLELAGGRFCRLLDRRRVAHLYYMSGARRLSLFVVPGPVRLEGVYAANALGRPVRMRRLAGHTLAIVAETPADADAFEGSLKTRLARAAR